MLAECALLAVAGGTLAPAVAYSIRLALSGALPPELASVSVPPLVLLTVAGAAACLPARRAARHIDPVVALREE